VLFGLLAFGSGAHAASTQPTPEEAEVFIASLADKALSALGDQTKPLEAREATFRELLREGFNLRIIGLYALGRHRRTADPAEIATFQDLFSEFVLRRYASLLGGYSGERFEVVGANASGPKDVLVESKISRPNGQVIQALWRTRKYDGEVKIIDVIVEGISMVQAQRDEFDAVITKGGFEALIESLRAANDLLPAEGG